MFKLFKSTRCLLIVLAFAFSASQAFPFELNLDDSRGSILTVQSKVPAVANQPFDLIIKFANNKVLVSNMTVQFKMSMNMGNFIYKPTYDNTSKAFIIKQLTLPKCVSGNTEWSGIIKYSMDDDRYTRTFVFNLLPK